MSSTGTERKGTAGFPTLPLKYPERRAAMSGVNRLVMSNTAYRKINVEGKYVMGKIVQTAGRDALGEFAPEFAHFNDDVLFGENWKNENINLKTRSIITVVALMAQGITDSSLKFHLQNAKNHGVTKKEIAAVVTHAAFYAGWPKAWAAFNLAKEVWTEE